MIKRLLSGSAIIYATIFCLLALLFAKNGLDMAIPMKGILLVAIAPAFFAYSTGRCLTRPGAAGPSRPKDHGARPD